VAASGAACCKMVNAPPVAKQALAGWQDAKPARATKARRVAVPARTFGSAPIVSRLLIQNRLTSFFRQFKPTDSSYGQVKNMSYKLFAIAVGLIAMLMAGSVTAQSCQTYNGGSQGVVGADGMTQPTCPEGHRNYPPRVYAPVYAVRDPYSPQPLYTYGRNGIDASRTHVWNQQQSQQYSWHGPYSYWRWNQPTALVVPPTAAFQTEYNWGVAQTRSLPINHQFGFNNPATGGIGVGVAPGTPYWPNSTHQFGVYPVRGPWN